MKLKDAKKLKPGKHEIVCGAPEQGRGAENEAAAKAKADALTAEALEAREPIASFLNTVTFLNRDTGAAVRAITFRPWRQVVKEVQTGLFDHKNRPVVRHEVTFE